MPEEHNPTQPEEQVGEAPADRIAELQRLVRGLEKHIIEKDERIADLEKDNAELVALNRDPLDPNRLLEMEQLAFTDSLTGVFSRRGFERQAKLSIARQIEALRDLKRSESEERRAEVKSVETLSFILLDIDYFKNVNDTFGHATGDGVLRELGQVLNTYIRGHDFVGRWGGEEFILCISSPHEDVRRQVAERLRRAISEIDVLDPDGVSVKVTASFGVADWEDGDTVEDTIGRADAALYVAKQAGRDQVVTEHRENRESFYRVNKSPDPIPKSEIKDFLKATERNR